VLYSLFVATFVLGDSLSTYIAHKAGGLELNPIFALFINNWSVIIGFKILTVVLLYFTLERINRDSLSNRILACLDLILIGVVVQNLLVAELI